MSQTREQQQEVYNAITGVAAKSENILVSLVKSVEETIDALLRKTYAKNEQYQHVASVQPLIGNIPDSTFASQIERFNEITKEAAAHNIETLKTDLRSAFAGRPIEPALAKKIQQGQDEILKMAIQLNDLAKKIEPLMKQQAMLLGDSKKADPEVAKNLGTLLGKYQEMNSKLKEAMKQQNVDVNKAKVQADQGYESPKPGK